MGEFFKFVIRFCHGWRRKLGVATLVLTLAFMGEWIRSFVRKDSLWLLGNPFISVNGDVYWEPRAPGEGSERLISWGSEEYTHSTPSEDADENMLWKWELLGLSIGEFNPPNWCMVGSNSDEPAESPRPKYSDTVIFTCQIQYGSIVIPLTLLSACLLLSKPRVATRMKTSEHVPAKGA